MSLLHAPWRGENGPLDLRADANVRVWLAEVAQYVSSDVVRAAAHRMNPKVGKLSTLSHPATVMILPAEA
jgi:hypothetical protein